MWNHLFWNKSSGLAEVCLRRFSKMLVLYSIAALAVAAAALAGAYSLLKDSLSNDW